MVLHIKWYLLFCFTFLFCACQQEFTYSYLIEHPAILKKEVAHCRFSEDKTPTQVAHCEIVLYAAANFISLLNEQQENPEQFGQRIMTTQLAYIRAQHHLQQVKKDLAIAAVDQVNQRKAKLREAEKKYQETGELLRTLLAVVGLNTPE